MTQRIFDSRPDKELRTVSISEWWRIANGYRFALLSWLNCGYDSDHFRRKCNRFDEDYRGTTIQELHASHDAIRTHAEELQAEITDLALLADHARVFIKAGKCDLPPSTEPIIR